MEGMFLAIVTISGLLAAKNHQKKAFFGPLTGFQTPLVCI
jgi:hypothetical protein